MKIFNLSFEKSVGGVIFRKDENNNLTFLLLHYPSGHWDFPKGHMEISENEEQTLRREIQEETGIDKLNIILGFRESIRYFYQAKGEERKKRIKNNNNLNIFKKVIYYVAAAEKTDIIISDEHTGFEWLAYEEALARITFRNSIDILVKADAFLEKNL